MGEIDWSFLGGLALGLLIMLPFRLIIIPKQFVIWDHRRGWVWEWQDADAPTAYEAEWEKEIREAMQRTMDENDHLRAELKKRDR